MTRLLSESEHDAIHREIGAANGLPNRVYVCAQTAAIERDSVLANSWTCIGFESDLAPAQALPVELLGLPLLMVRDAAGITRVFHNVCRHRGHRLVSKACTLQGSIRCPYHSWTYGLDGRLNGTPHIGGTGIHAVDGFDRNQRGLFEVRSAVWLGLVFVNLSANAPPFAAHVAPLEQRWQAFVGVDGLASLRVATDPPKFQLEVTSNWKLAVENYCESYHLPWIHPQLNIYSRIEDHYPILGSDWGAGQGTTVFDFNTRAGIRFPQFPNWPNRQRKVAEYIALFPNLLLGLHIDHLYAMLLLPLAHNRTLEIAQYYFVGDEALGDQYATARQTLSEGWQSIFNEDIGVVEGMQSGRYSPAFDGGAFSPALDSATHHFHRWIADRLTTT